MNKKAKPKQKKKQINPTMQSLIGIFVFAFGLAAVIAVLYLGYARFYKPSEQVKPQEEVNQVEDIGQYLGDAQKLNLRKANYSDLVGQWKGRYNSLTTHINITDEKQFQITLFMDIDGYERLISWGSLNFQTGDAVLTLQPSYAQLPKVEDAEIRTLTRRVYGVVALVNEDDNSLYIVPHALTNGRDQIHPIFTRMERQGSFIRLVLREE